MLHRQYSNKHHIARAMLEAVVGTAKERGVNLSADATLAAGTTKAVNASAVILANQFRW
jgi:hypothetical protein